tara:strand:+ start:602 stop:1123 length:522 start_codon:yes stop_codon:yes gene_type:complete
MSELRTNRIIPRDGLPSGSSGGIIQVKSATKTDGNFNTSSSSYTDVTGLSVTITPTRSDSKILIFANIHGVGNSDTQAYFRFMRDSTPICIGDAAGGRVQATLGSMYYNQQNDTKSCSQNFLDSPSTTSAVTYKIQARTQGNGTLYVNRSSGDDNNATSGRFTSTITVMEVSG